MNQFGTPGRLHFHPIGSGGLGSISSHWNNYTISGYICDRRESGVSSVLKMESSTQNSGLVSSGYPNNAGATSAPGKEYLKSLPPSQKESPESASQESSSSSSSSQDALIKRIAELEADHAVLRAQIAKLLTPAQTEYNSYPAYCKNSALNNIRWTPPNVKKSTDDTWDSQRISSLLTLPGRSSSQEVLTYGEHPVPISKNISEKHLLQSIGQAVYIFTLSAEVIYW